MFAGTFTALITPFRDGHLDRDAFQALIERQIAAGITGVVPVGTTGESPTLDSDEHLAVVKAAVEFADGKIKVLAGSGANSTREAIHLTQAAEAMGADASLQVCPYYNKPSQEGLYQHYKTVAENTGLPIMLYSVPGRSVIEIGIETVSRLANDCDNIVANKEAGGSVDRVNQLVQAVPEDFQILSGDDPLTLPFMSCGAVGLVSVASNLIPEVMVSLVNRCLEGEYGEALELQKRYYPLLSGLMSLDTNPVPIKSAVALQGHCTSELRLPLIPLSDEKTESLRGLLKTYGLL
ncbi:4-hydroxy-tetrahydrodipicolinate synthase [Akkermansiaceae bacterium]|nr:4-hydroxy-tetrahydrodipicolinate synthase [bacterium]MDB2430319.1 4-hydroxy-tetrahydrodipicolinate synthase [Akkermansiaceae bacterium]MDB4759365.1 4-hydroxy-tetrahydrodipicolinate synthase [Akkermansiaceae bacterium]MDG1071578.1 4-hydroxy-tetrahydrodipicolinate synthase [Akkermansiaceae bacterium]MDG1672047.1 4-hydroxy-tetrahydrodipicolinate synthase [Akkermansiaceae bacterium]